MKRQTMEDALAQFLMEQEFEWRERERNYRARMDEYFQARERELTKREDQIMGGLQNAVAQTTIAIERVHYELEIFIRACSEERTHREPVLDERLYPHD